MGTFKVPITMLVRELSDLVLRNAHLPVKWQHYNKKKANLVHHFVFRISRRYADHMEGLNHPVIQKLAPSAKIYDYKGQETCFMQSYFKLFDVDNVIMVVEVTDDNEAETLLSCKDLLSRGSYWSKPNLAYVFRNVKREALDADAIMIKLDDRGEYVEPEDTCKKAEAFSTFNRRLKKFMVEVTQRQGYFDPVFVQMINDAATKFASEQAELKELRRKAKAEATKTLRSFKTRLMRYAIYKA